MKPGLRAARKLAAEFGATITIKDFSGSAWGFVSYSSRKIIIKPKYARDVDILMGMVMHECGHLVCRDNGLWPAYHNRNREDPAFRLTAWKAELWIDRWAEAELKRRFPSVTYKNGYDESDREWFRAEVLGD